MKRRIKYAVFLLAVALFASGCSMRTVDEMYVLPKRSEDYSNLQSAMDQAMVNLEFSAPLSGDNQQSVQMADVDGDGEQEYMVFAKANSELPLRILIFDRKGDQFVHTDTVESNGTAFDQVEYIQMDDKPGVEMVLGRQVSDQLVRSVSVYTFSSGEAEQLMTANYQKFVTVDLDDNGYDELFLLHPGLTETDNGVAELYGMENGIMVRSNEMPMSGPVGQLKRILVGKLHDKKTAVYVASTVNDTSLITDVYTKAGQRLVNVSLSNESGTSVQTLRNYYVYADDMDDDGVVELPRLSVMVPLDTASDYTQSDLLMWYALNSDGTIEEKLYTYYDATGGWYLELDKALAPRVTVERKTNLFEFYIWNEDYSLAQKVLTIYTLTAQNREEQSLADGRFVLMRTDTVTYAASLDAAAANYQITKESIVSSFRLIHRDWNSGEM
ncbi:MAG: hypothetical protein E7421_03720 [Ruminococcaceae bacterium]|nr:hypothetical protein [Oscillospiraceae bacterium]